MTLPDPIPPRCLFHPSPHTPPKIRLPPPRRPPPKIPSPYATTILTQGGFLQEASRSFLMEALPKEQIGFALDEIGIAVTKINARYLYKQLREVFGNKICPNLIINPRSVPPKGYRIYLATGAVPGSSTDYDTILLAESFSPDRVIKVSDFPVVLDVKALEFDKRKLAEYKSLPEITWEELLELVGTEWVEGGNYPLDPKAAALGSKLAEKAEFSLLIGQYEELESMIDNKEFTGTKVKN